MITYQIACQPLTHLFNITMRIQDPVAQVTLMLPVWTPGSYLVREYSRHLQEFSCEYSWQKVNKNTWQIEVPTETAELVVTYKIYAYELSVRTSHLDQTHGYFNCACVCLLYAPAREQFHRLELELPYADWQIATSLKQETTTTYRAADYDELIDSPVEMGLHEAHSFVVLEKTHRLVIWGKGNYQVTKIIEDATQIIGTTAQIFGGLPYDEYLFMLHVADSYGGLEHKNSTSLLFPRLQFQPREKYEKFLQLVAHEFFHTWNIKRLRPQTLDHFDYSQENYVSVLWFCEGATAYYDELICLRAGLYDDKRYLHLLSDAITRLETTPGQQIQCLTQSSWDAWIKLYRPDENSVNSSVSYYLRGHLVICLLDLQIRQTTNKTFDDVFRQLWQTYQTSGGQAYGEADLWCTIEQVAGVDLTDFYDRYIAGIEPLPYDKFLGAFGLQLIPHYEKIPYTGIRLDQEKPIIKVVESNSPAQHARLCPGDELVALEDYRITVKNWPDLLHLSAAPRVTFFRRDQLMQTTLNPAPAQPTRYSVTPLPKVTPEQQRLYQAWLKLKV